MDSIDQMTPSESILQRILFEPRAQYSLSNMNYRLNEDRLVISKKFFEVFAATTTVPPFTPNNFSTWKDSLQSYLRQSYGMDTLINDGIEREILPVQVENESESEYQWRIATFRQRDLALYLVLDKAINTGKDIDPKYRSLATAVYRKAIIEGQPYGQVLFDELSMVVKGSPLHSRINSITELAKIKMDKTGSEQHIFNVWKRVVESLKSLQMDADALYKMFLIKAIGHTKEHQGVMVALASLPPQELLELPAETILARFLASAEHSRGLKGTEIENSSALFASTHVASDVARKRKADVVCYSCGKAGHYSSDCRSKTKASKPSGSDRSNFKKGKKA
jgi:hypothetical protein